VGFVGAGGEYRQRRNLEAIDVRGIEVDGRIELGRWTFSGGYSFADAEVKAAGAALPLDGLRPAQTPRHTAASTVAWRSNRGARASLTARYTGGQYEDDLNEQLLPDALHLRRRRIVPANPRPCPRSPRREYRQRARGRRHQRRRNHRTRDAADLWIGLSYRD
jgi:outer membrane receptor protein involved in Fe transport